VLVAQGNLADALKSFRDSLAIRDRLAKADPDNAGWQRDLALGYGKVATLLVKYDRDEPARTAFDAGRTIMQRLVGLSPDNATWRNDLAWFDRQITELEPNAAE